MNAVEGVLQMNAKGFRRRATNDGREDRTLALFDPDVRSPTCKVFKAWSGVVPKESCTELRITDNIPETSVWSCTAIESPLTWARSKPVCE